MNKPFGWEIIPLILLYGGFPIILGWILRKNYEKHNKEAYKLYLKN